MSCKCLAGRGLRVNGIKAWAEKTKPIGGGFTVAGWQLSASLWPAGWELRTGKCQLVWLRACSLLSRGLNSGILEGTRVENMQKNAQAAEQNDGTAHLIRETAAAVSVEGTPRMDYESLVTRLRHGDRTAAEELVDVFYERIYLFMRAVGHDRQISEDLTQETFLRVWYHIGQLRDGKALNGWLFRIAGNVSRLHWRQHKDTDSTGPDGPETPPGEPNGLEGASGQEDLIRLKAAVAQLPQKLRQAVVLHYMEQLSISEAADAAHVRQGTLKSRLNRGLEALRKNMGEQ